MSVKSIAKKIKPVQPLTLPGLLIKQDMQGPKETKKGTQFTKLANYTGPRRKDIKTPLAIKKKTG